MSFDPNHTYVRRPVCQTTFFIGLNDSNDENVNEAQPPPPPESKPVRTGLWIALDDKQSESENKCQPKKTRRRSSRGKQGLDWVPLKENFVNTPDNLANVEFTVPQRLPLKLKKKLTPLKSTPRRRSSGANSSLRRETFRVTPRSSSHIKMLPKSITTTKKRRSGGQTPLIKTPRNRPLLDLSTSSSNTSFTPLGVEEIQYLSWLNVMLSSKGDEKNGRIDSDQLILDCFNSEKIDPTLCPSKEEISAEMYRESLKWNQLRSLAISLYKSESLTKINKKLMDDIRHEKFMIRKDRAVHADIGYRKHITGLLLSYNFLWLRIGLETVFQTKISTTSGTMASNLINFIEQNLLESKQLMNRYCPKAVKHYFKDEIHISETKKYILSKFLLLINFLDAAKQARLIEHNPCLFRINSTQKSTQEVIRSFASEFITGVGDIIKYLKVSVGLSMGYKQTPIEEFSFEVTNLAQDLRCGIRLARLAELITDNKDLLSKLLYPATNTTRKIHNLNIALKALDDIVPHGITAQDIQKGNRTKTIKLLDAIIFKHKTDQILREEKLRIDCVIAIQNRFRANLLMKKERKEFENLKHFTVLVQRRFRANKVKIIEKAEANRLMITERNRFLALKKYTIALQRIFRASRLMKIQRQHFLALKHSSLVIQRLFRANRLMINERKRFLTLKRYTIAIQRLFKANRLMKIQTQHFLALKHSSIAIQRRFRANRLMRIERQYFIALKNSSIVIQNRFRANRQMITGRNSFLTLKRYTISIQRLYKANRLMKSQRQHYLDLKHSLIVIQRRFRANRLMITERNRFITLKRHTIFTQRLFRANRLMKIQRQYFIALKESSIVIQKRLRANRLMIAERNRFLALKQHTIAIQRRFRAKKSMKTERQYFIALKHSLIVIQRRFRANRLMITERNRFLALKRHTIALQRLFRANKLMKTQRQNFIALKHSSIVIQNRFRANRLMKKDKQYFMALKHSSIIIQRRFKANRLMIIERQYFMALKHSSIVIQNRFRANRQMITERNSFLALKRYTTSIQRLFKANRLMKAQRQHFLALKHSSIVIQRRFRANRLMKIERQYFIALKNSSIIIQNRFRANRQMITERNSFLTLKRYTIFIQRLFRAEKSMKIQRQYFIALKHSSIFIQRRFRANRLMITERNRFIALRRYTIALQRLFRAKKLMTTYRLHFDTLKHSAIIIQRRFRANRLMRKQREEFQTLKKSVVFVQRLFRNNRKIKLERKIIIESTIKIQSLWRGYKTRKAIHEENQKVKSAFNRIQSSIALVSEEMRLCNRTYNSLQILLAYDSLLPLAHDLDSLERTTSLIPDTCETMANAGAVPILLKILNEPNRSEPHKQIYLMSLNILLNLAKCDNTLPNLICNSQTIETVFRIAKNFYRHNKIIEICFTLLWVLLKNDSILEYVKSDKRKLETIKRIYEHSKKDKSFKKYKLKNDYKFAPKWQIGKKNVYQFSNHFVAIQAIASRLNVL